MLRSSLFIQNEFRISSVFPVGGDQNEIHTGKNAEALACYKTILDKYPQSIEAYDIDRYIAEVSE